MNVLEVAPMPGESVIFDSEPKWCIRYSADDWHVCTGMGTYILTDCTKVETAYQAFKNGDVSQ